MKKPFYLVVFALSVLAELFLLGGCAPYAFTTQPPQATEMPASTEQVTPGVQPSSTAVPTATQPPAASQESSETPAATPVLASPGQPSQGAQGAAQAAAQNLALAQNAAVADVQVLGVEPVNWRDACLGVSKAGMMCAQVITPGYQITLELNGQQYVYHTDASGNQVVLAETPAQASGEVLTWTQEENGACNQLVASATSLQFGGCQGGLQTSAQFFEQMKGDLMVLAGKYAPFSAETPAGKVEFKGRGKTQASPAEQRMVAEWARLAFQVAQSGRSGAAWGMALDWQREGGIAGFCDEVTIYRVGYASTASCKEAPGPEHIWLSAEQLSQVYAWVDSLASFDFEHKDPATADAMQIRLAFSGSGSGKATDGDIQAMQDLALEILNQQQVAADPMRTLQARTALEDYFAALREGRYADAAALFGGDVATLVSWNPDADPADLPGLFERGCTQNGLVCGLSIAKYLEESRLSPTDYSFTVELSNRDGSPFSRGPCCGEATSTPPETSFTFTVREVDGAYKALDLPVYVP